MKNLSKPLLAGLLALLTLSSMAQEAAIRKSIQERLPDWPRIDEVNKTPMPGLYEIRINGVQIFYTDAAGNYLIEGGSLVDLRQRRNLTEERMDKLTAISFDDLPVKDAFTVVRGNGTRKVAIFADPNCGYCKHFERELANVDNITIHTFLYPILSRDSAEKSRNIWCAKDRNKSWQDWMLNDQVPPPLNCDAGAIARNLTLGRKHNVTGTPTLIFADGKRVSGALPMQQFEKQLSSATR
ncbi:DsbC family protein [Curvibacter fontanus]